MAGNNDALIAELVDTFDGLPYSDQCAALCKMARKMMAKKTAVAPAGMSFMRIIGKPDGQPITVAMAERKYAGVLATAYDAMKRALGIETQEWPHK